MGLLLVVKVNGTVLLATLLPLPLETGLHGEDQASYAPTSLHSIQPTPTRTFLTPHTTYADLRTAQGAFGAWDASLDPVLLEMAQAWWYLDASAAATDLGFAPRDPRQTVADTVEWLRAHESQLSLLQ